MRAMALVLLCACDTGPRPVTYNPTSGPGIEATSEPAGDSEGVRLDLPVYGTSTSGADLSTSAADTADLHMDLGAVGLDVGGSTGEMPGSTSTGGEDSSGSTGSTGEPPAPDVCGDGVCTGTETLPECWAPGWCPGDCLKQPKCISDCPCEPGITTFCNLAPGVCSATKPGGYCDPNGDGAYFDGDFTKGAQEHAAKCG